MYVNKCGKIFSNNLQLIVYQENGYTGQTEFSKCMKVFTQKSRQKDNHCECGNLVTTFFRNVSIILYQRDAHREETIHKKGMLQYFH